MSVERESLHLDIEGCFNVRDAGGWPTVDGRWMRTGRLYRADDPIRITERGREAIAALGFEAVVDLRTPAQAARSTGFADPAITYQVPMVDYIIDYDDPPRLEEPGDLELLYQEMLGRGGAQLIRAMKAIAMHIGDGPVLVHCAAGKDRTGMLVALIQASIGVRFESIVEEYALSDEPTRRRRREMIEKPLHDDPPVSRSPEFLWTAPAEAMTLFLQRGIEVHGSLEAWPLALGATPDTVQRLEAALLSDGTPEQLRAGGSP
jgi:protein-tyrosine phosphatase